MVARRPSPSRHRGVCSGLRPWLRIVHRQSRPPLGVAHDRGAELGIRWKPGVISSAAEQGHEHQTLLRRDREIMMAGEHVLVASAPFGIDGRSAHHLNPPVRDVSTMLLAHAPSEHRSDLRGLELHEVVETVQPASERVPAAAPLVDGRDRIGHRSDASTADSLHNVDIGREVDDEAVTPPAARARPRPSAPWCRAGERDHRDS